MKTTMLRYTVVIKREGKVFVSYVPTLGISDFGKTIEETKKHTHDAIECHVEGLLKSHTDIPAPDDTDFTISQAQVTVTQPLHFA